MGSTKGRKTQSWSEAEIQFVKDNAEILTRVQLASQLGRTRPSVQGLCLRLGLKDHARNWNRWTKQDDLKLLELSEMHTYSEIAERMGRTRASIFQRMWAKGIRKLSGGVSLTQLCKNTGYERSQFLRAKKMLRQNWKTAYGGKRKLFVITEKQQEALTEYLKTEPRRITPPEKKFWPRVVKSTDPDGCWQWTGGKLFSYIYPDGRQTPMQPARAAWVLTKGDPGGRKVQTACKNYKCVNPKHHYIKQYVQEAA